MFNLVDKSRGLLFASRDINELLQGHSAAIRQEVDQLDANRVLNTAIADLQEYFIEKYVIAVPVLRRDLWSVSEREANVDARNDPHRWIDDRSRPALVKGQTIEVEVPIEGEIELMYTRPSTFSTSVPRAQIRGNSLFLKFDIPHDAGQKNIRPEIDRILTDIDQYLGWTQKDIAAFNQNLPHQIEQLLTGRRERILANQGRVSSLGIPLKNRPDAPKTYSLPTMRRKVAPVLPNATSAAYTPEPVLDSENYDHILSVIQNMAAVMERSPSAFKQMGEEDLRQHFLVQLNGQFEGAATGETFNVNGKTDILLRANGKNVFIAECKFWKGAKQYTAAIDQLLSYTAWRDTKTAILIFNRGTAMSTVLASIRAESPSHKNFKRAMNWGHESGFRYVFHQNGDVNRELLLTVLVFDVPT